MTKARVWVSVAVLAAFLAGSVFAGYIRPQFSSAPATPAAPTALIAQAQAPAPRRAAERRSSTLHRKRSWEREVLIVGGSAGAGAAIGAAAKGKRGAAVGALTGGVAGLIYDIATRNR